MTLHVFRTEVEIGGETVKVAAIYLWTTPRRATRTDPDCGGVDLVNIELDWEDQPWVDDLLQQINRKHGNE